MRSYVRSGTYLLRYNIDCHCNISVYFTASDRAGTYPVVAVSLASATVAQPSLKSGQICRITTGGPLPPGADAVVMVEDTVLSRASEDGMVEDEVQILVDVTKGENIRDVGSDVLIGEIVLKKGDLITIAGGEVGVLASIGLREVSSRGFARMVCHIFSPH
jgi:gephyrin